MVWLLSTRIGLETVAGTRNTGRRRWLDSALAGTLFAIILGVIVGVMTPLAASPAEVERGELPGLVLSSALVMIALGTPVCVAGSTFTGWLYVRRRGLP